MRPFSCLLLAPLGLGLGVLGCNHGMSSPRDSATDVASDRSPLDSALDFSGDRSPPDSAADLSRNGSSPDATSDRSSDRSSPDSAVDLSVDRSPPDSATDRSSDRSSLDSGMDGSGDRSPGASGVEASRYLDELGADEIRQLCSWLASIIEPGDHRCSGGAMLTTFTASECADTIVNSASRPHCPVSLVENCFSSTGGDACKILDTDACKAYMACAYGQ